MNTNSRHDNALLEELISSEAAAHAPSAATILSQIRHEKRRRIRTQAAAGLILAAGALTALLIPERPIDRSLAGPGDVSPAPAFPPLERIDGPTMLRELGDQPAALATLPDGSQRLILLVSLPQDLPSPAE